MTPRTNVLYSVAAQSGADDTGAWFANEANDPRTHIPVAVVISGTTSVEVQGRNDPAGVAVTLATLTTSDVVMVAKTAQIHIKRASATTATIKATVDKYLKTV